jgi:hypothetical protein
MREKDIFGDAEKAFAARFTPMSADGERLPKSPELPKVKIEKLCHG